MSTGSHTSFERRRGVNAVRVRDGLAHLQVVGLPRESLMPSRLAALDRLKQAGIKIDFLKLTSDGFTFVVDEKMASDAAAALVGTEVMATTGRAMLSVHCANIRDEAGIVGKIAESVMASGARIEQVGDSHDCILLVVESDRANDAAARLRADFGLDGDDAH